jgi:hypothetical protein
MEDLAVPEDHPTPDSPVISVTERYLEACHADRALATKDLGRGQLIGTLGEEKVVLSASDASSSAQNVFHDVLSNLISSRLGNGLAATKRPPVDLGGLLRRFGSYEDFTRSEAA